MSNGKKQNQQTNRTKINSFLFFKKKNENKKI